MRTRQIDRRITCRAAWAMLCITTFLVCVDQAAGQQLPQTPEQLRAQMFNRIFSRLEEVGAGIGVQSNYNLVDLVNAGVAQVERDNFRPENVAEALRNTGLFAEMLIRVSTLPDGTVRLGESSVGNALSAGICPLYPIC